MQFDRLYLDRTLGFALASTQQGSRIMFLLPLDRPAVSGNVEAGWP